MSSRLTLLMLPSNMCDARLRKRELGTCIFILSLENAFLPRSVRQLAGTILG